MVSRTLLLVLLMCVPSAAIAQDATVRLLLDSPQFKTETAFIEKDQTRYVREQIELTRITAPPYKEERRAKAYLQMLRDAGLTDVQMEQEGNVLGLRKGTGSGDIV